ncbi:hypothetical protein R3I93_018348 [Phoxinus phoxinus]
MKPGHFLQRWTTTTTTTDQCMSTTKAKCHKNDCTARNHSAFRVQTVKVAKDYSYIPDLQIKILGLRLQSARGLPRKRSYRPDDPRFLGPLSGIVPPPTADLVQSQVHRGQEMPSAP